jgi:hypothetical protein
MNPEEKALLERTFRLSEENNKILRTLQKKARWAFVWGIMKVLIIVIPIVLGYLYFAPFIGEALENFQLMKSFIGGSGTVLSR